MNNKNLFKKAGSKALSVLLSAAMIGGMLPYAVVSAKADEITEIDFATGETEVQEVNLPEEVQQEETLGAETATASIAEDFETGTYLGYKRDKAVLEVVDGGRTGKALKISGRVNTWDTYAYDVSEYAGGTAKVVAYIKTEDTNAVCEISDDASYWNWAITKNASADGWTKVSGKINLPKDVKMLYFSTGGGKGDYLVDDVTIDFTYTENAEESIERPYTYTFKELKISDAGADNTGADIDVDDNGIVTITASREWGQAFWYLPAELDDMIITSATLDKVDGSANPAFKLLTPENYADPNRGGDFCSGNIYGVTEIKAASEKLGLNVRYLGLMSMNPAVPMQFKSITFYCKVPERVISGARDLMADADGNFETTDNKWTDANGTTTGLEYKSYAKDAAPKPTNKDKYVRTKNVAGGVVKLETTKDNAAVYYDSDDINRGYQFAFWARTVSENTVKDPGLEFDVMTYNDGNANTVKANITYDDYSATKLTKDWQKFSGVFDFTSAYKENVNHPTTNNIKIEFKADEAFDFELDNVQIATSGVPLVDTRIPSLYQKVIGVKDTKIEYMGVAIPTTSLSDNSIMTLVEKHFNSVSCENAMKPEVILGSAPTKENATLDDVIANLNFEEPDKTADYFKKYNANHPTDPIKLRFHVFVWHSQTPTWWFREGFKADGDYVSKEEMNKRVEAYIKAVGQHYEKNYPGLIYAWDVVNEQANDSGGVRNNGDWYNVYGGSDEYIINAFEYADKYLSEDAILFYNDYNECTPTKCDTIVKFLKKIRVVIGEDRLLGAGMQGHHDMASPSIEAIETAMRRYAKVADIVHITELDVKSSVGYRDNNDDPTVREVEDIKQGYRYQDIYNAAKKINEEYKNRKVNGYVQCITIWGSHDAVSWLKTSNSVGGSADGKTPQYPLLFDDNFKAKPAFYAFIEGDSAKPLAPNVKSSDAVEATDFALAKPISYKIGEDVVKIKPIWNAGGLKVSVSCNSLAAGDTISLYVDESNSKKGGTFTADTKTVTAGTKEYTFDKAMKLKPFDTVAFDIAIQKGSKVYSYNDTTNSQATTSRYYAELVLKPFITVAQGGVYVDGKIDEWADVESVPLSVVTDDPEATGVAKLAWDSDNLYILMDVEDDVLDASDSAADHEQDSVEIFIDELNEKAGSYDLNDKQYRVNYKNKQSFNGATCLPQNIVSKAWEKEDKTGYYVEMAIKWTALEAAAGSLVGIDLQVNDAQDGGRIGCLNWYDASGNGWQNPSVYGTVSLGASTASASTKITAVTDKIKEMSSDVELTDECKAAIDEVREAYNALTFAERGLVVGVNKLVSAEQTYQALVDAEKAAVKAVEDLIDAIGEVNLTDSKALIDAAREAYDALTPAQKKMVDADKLKALESAEKDYAEKLSEAEKAEAEKKAKADKDAADAAKKAIDAIGTVDASDACKAKIEAARKAYDALTDVQKKLVSADTLKKLTDAEAAYKKAVEEASKPSEPEKPADTTEYKAEFSAKSTTIQKGKSSQNLAKDIVLTPGDKVVKWESSNKKVATITSKGKLKAKKTGTTTITATTAKGVKVTIKVSVKSKKVKTTKLTVMNAETNKKVKSVTIKKGKKLTLKAVTNPITTPDKLTFKSSKKSVAKVTSKGVITAKKAGNATITVKSGKKSVKVKVKVTK